MVKTRKTRRPRRVRRNHRKTKRGGGFFDFFKSNKVVPEPDKRHPIVSRLSDVESKRLFEIEDELEDLANQEQQDQEKINRLTEEKRALTEKSFQDKPKGNQYAATFTKCKKSNINLALGRGDCYTLKTKYKPEFQFIDNTYNKFKQKVIQDLKEYVDNEYKHLPFYAGQNVNSLVNVYRKIVVPIIEKYNIGTSETQQVIEQVPYKKEKAFVYYPATKYLSESDIQYFCFAVYDIMTIHNGQSLNDLWYRVSEIDNVPFDSRDSLISYFGNKISCDKDINGCYDVLYSTYSPETAIPEKPKHFIDENGTSDLEEKETFYVDKPELTETISDLDEENPYRDTEYDVEETIKPVLELEPEPTLSSTIVVKSPPAEYNVLKTTAESPSLKTEDLIRYINMVDKTKTKTNPNPCVSEAYKGVLAEEKRKCNKYEYNLRNYFNCSKVNRKSACKSDKEVLRNLPKVGGTRRHRRSRHAKKTRRSHSRSRKHH